MSLSIFHRLNKLFLKKNRFSHFIYQTTGFISFDTEIFELALTHRSASIYHGKGFSVNNERLEFLGDSILNAIVSDYLFEKYPNENEGFLTGLRSRIVNRQSLNDLAIKIQLDKQIICQIDKSDLPPSLVGNALEAFIGAVFIDKGYETSKNFVIKKLIEPFTDLKKLSCIDTNFKGRIIDWAQKNHNEIEFLCREEIVSSRSGHLFLITLMLNGVEFSFGQAESKKEAEQKASEDALLKLNLIK